MSKEEYTIRQAEGDDGKALRELWIALHKEQAELDQRTGLSDDAPERWENDYSEWLEDDDCCLLAAVDSEEIIGFIFAEWWYPPPTEPPVQEVFIDSLYVIPERRNQGIGRRLVMQAADWARSREAKRLRFGVLYANENGRAFWYEQGAKDLISTMTLDLY